MTKKKTKISIGKKQFIRELAFRANFTIKDTQDIWDKVEEIFREAIESKTELKIKGFGNLYYVESAERAGVDPKTLEPKVFPPSCYVAFKFAIPLRDLAHLDKVEKPWKSRASNNFEEDFEEDEDALGEEEV